MTGVVRRVAAFRGQLALLGALALVAAALVTGVPRLANHLADLGLRERVSELPYQVRDITYQTVLPPGMVLIGLGPEEPATLLHTHQRTFKPALRDLIGGKWYSVQTGPGELRATGKDLPVNGSALPAIGLRSQAEIKPGSTLTAGEWPSDDPATRLPGDPVEATVSRKVAAALRLRVGSRFRLDSADPRTGQLEVVITGIFEPLDPSSPIWVEEPELLDPFVPVGQDNVPYRGVLMVDDDGINAAGEASFPMTHRWRYRIDSQRLVAADVATLTEAVLGSRQLTPLDSDIRTGLDTALVRFQEKMTAVRALLAIVQAGVLATLFGLVLLAAQAAVDRRRSELALLRARGGAAIGIGGWLLVESLVAVPLAIALGWWLTSFLPGAPAGTGWLAVIFGLATALATPVLGMASQRRLNLTPVRSDLARQRPSARRLTAELSVLVAAGLGAYLLRRRGLSQDAGVDLFLACVPVLLATAAALLALRLFPWPLRALGRLAGRARGSVLFLGATRAGRASPASAGPLAVMVVAITIGVFSATITTTIDDAHDRAANAAVAADIRVGGYLFTPETGQRIGELAGVRAVAPITADPARPVLTDSGRNARRLTQSLVIVVDAPAFARVLASSGIDLDLPAALTDARRGTGPVPALVSPTVAREVAKGGAADVQGQLYDFRVAAVAETFPTVDPGAERFVVLPAQALVQPPTKPVLPTGFLVAGESVDLGTLAAIGDRGQRDWLAGTTRLVSPEGLDTTVTTWAAHRRSLERSGVNGVLSFTFGSGAAGGVTLALLAIGFAVLAGARARGLVLSRLRTMGMSGGQGRSLLLFELAPVITAGVLTGAAVGLVLPPLLAPALGLRAFTEGYVVGGVHLEPAIVAAIVGLAVLGLATALAVESAINRRLRLGEVLRLGEENGS